MQMTGRYHSYEAIVPSDVTLLDFDALYVGGAGNIVVEADSNGKTTTFSAIPAGTILPIHIIKVNATLTTATLIVGLRY